MGHPKALTTLDGEAALARIVRACEEAGVTRPVVVLGEHHEQVRAALPSLEGRVAWVRNPDPEAGRTGSLCAGLARLPEATELLVWPVDHPLGGPSVVRALLAADGEWVVPTRDGRGGHPILLRGAAIERARRADAAAPLRDVLSGARRVDVPTDDPGVLRNLDAPGDLA